jgi:hypothetical protein
MKYSLNDNLILEAYKQGQGLREEVSNGFAKVAQKVTLIGLKLMVPAKLSDGHYIPANSVAYIQEDLLMTQQWAKQVRKADFSEKEFIVVNKANIVMVSEAVQEQV